MSVSRRILVGTVAALVLASCGGSGDSTDRQRNSALEEQCVTSEDDRQNQIADWQKQVSDKEEALKAAGESGAPVSTVGPNPESSGEAPVAAPVAMRISADPLPPDEEHVPGAAFNADGTPAEGYEGQEDWLTLHGEVHAIRTEAETAIAEINALTVCGTETPVSTDETTPTVEGSTPGEETTTTVEGDTGEASVSTDGAGSSEMTLEEKWADCRNAPVVTLDKAEVERTGVLAYTVKWSCLKYVNGEVFDQSVFHFFNDGSRNQVRTSGNELVSRTSGDTFTYSAPIGAGRQQLLISASYSGWEHGWYDNTNFDPYMVDINVPSSAVADFKECKERDLVLAKDTLAANCSVTGMLQLRLNDDWKFLDAVDNVIDLSSMSDGWQDGWLTVESGARRFYLDGLFCARKCNVERSDLKAERTVGEDNYWTFKITRPSWCADPLIAWTEGDVFTSVSKGIRKRVGTGEMFWDDLEFGMIVDPLSAMVRIGSSRYWCFDAYGNMQTQALYADYHLSDDPEESASPTTSVAPVDTAPAPTTTVPAGPVAEVATQVLVPEPGGSVPEIQVPSNAAGLGVSAASIEAVLANAKTDVPVVLATFDTGDKVSLRRGRDAVLKVPAGAKSVTFTAFKKDGTKVETTATLVTAKPLVTVAVKSDDDAGSGFPVVPVAVLLVVLLAAGGAVMVRRGRGAAAE
jgi:hypothetical protein